MWTFPNGKVVLNMLFLALKSGVFLILCDYVCFR